MEKMNPNSIGEMLGFKEGVPTSADSVYRSLNADEAIKDIYDSGTVRSKVSAGLPSRYGDTVYWSKGRDGKNHAISNEGYVIEAPHDVAVDRIVTHEDLTGVYTKIDQEVVNILKDHEEEERQRQIYELRKKLGVVNL